MLLPLYDPKTVKAVNYFVDQHNKTMCSDAVLDISKAFDEVWHTGLLFKLTNSPLPRSVVWLLRPYFTNRSFQICVERE